ncbi:MAG: hypothetical protein IH991_11530 [Planctomycetes bacterium]|nr:hypothetical protein [Planctomycetota bacterium]
MPSTGPQATHGYVEGGLEDVLEFLKRIRNELRTLRKVRVWQDRVQIFDVNGEYFQIDQLGYQDADVVPLLRAVGTSFKPELIHDPISRQFKEFKTGRAFPWAEDRVM